MHEEHCTNDDCRGECGEDLRDCLSCGDEYEESNSTADAPWHFCSRVCEDI